MSEPVFFASADEWRAWLLANHDKAPEISVGFRKTRSGTPGIGYKEAVDEALAFGWIDGVRHSIDATAYRIRFTPRRKGSIWSTANITRIGELAALGRMHPAGTAAFECRDPSKARRYSFEQDDHRLAAPYEAALRSNASAWNFFQTQPPSYRKPATWWVMSAKKEETQQRRLATLIECCEQGRPIPPMKWAVPKERR
jgi:uncharacterized protein YdeI (YjbR/CyaY-like superfamily)